MALLLTLGSCVIDVDRRGAWLSGRRVTLEPKMCDLLRLLVEESHSTLSDEGVARLTTKPGLFKDLSTRLFGRPGRSTDRIETDRLHSLLSRLRRLLGPGARQWLETHGNALYLRGEALHVPGPLDGVVVHLGGQLEPFESPSPRLFKALRHHAEALLDRAFALVEVAPAWTARIALALRWVAFVDRAMGAAVVRLVDAVAGRVAGYEHAVAIVRYELLNEACTLDAAKRLLEVVPAHDPLDRLRIDIAQAALLRRAGEHPAARELLTPWEERGLLQPWQRRWSLAMALAMGPSSSLRVRAAALAASAEASAHGDADLFDELCAVHARRMLAYDDPEEAERRSGPDPVRGPERRAEVERCLDRAEQIVKTLGITRGPLLIAVRNGRGEHELKVGHYTAAAIAFEKEGKVRRAWGDVDGTAGAMANAALAFLYAQQGQHALGMLKRSLELTERGSLRRFYTAALLEVARVVGGTVGDAAVVREAIRVYAPIWTTLIPVLELWEWIVRYGPDELDGGDALAHLPARFTERVTRTLAQNPANPAGQILYDLLGE